HARGRVDAGEERHFRRMELAHDVELVRDEPCADRERVTRETLENRRARLGPRCDPTLRGVRQVRILRDIRGVDEPLPALPEERWTLPLVRGSDLLDDSRLSRWIVRPEKCARTLRAAVVFVLDVLVFVRRARLEDANEVFEGALARGDRLRRAD